MIRRVLLVLGLGCGTMLVAVALSIGLLGPPCLLGCDRITTGTEAQARVQAALPAPLPEGVAVTHLLDGGFQDRFVQIRLQAPETALPALLPLFGADPGALATAPNRHFGASDAPWWPLTGLPQMRAAPAYLSGYDHARIATAPDDGHPGRVLVFVFASQI